MSISDDAEKQPGDDDAAPLNPADEAADDAAQGVARPGQPAGADDLDDEDDDREEDEEGDDDESDDEEDDEDPEAVHSRAMKKWGARIEAKPSWWHPGKILIFGLVLVGVGGWFMKDGFFVYPRERQEDLKARAETDPKRQIRHDGFDIPMQQALAVILPIAGLLMAGKALLMARGTYRLEDEVLHIVGHPPIPIDAITRIDKRKWDRKGIALVAYELADGKSGEFKLDDFSHDRPPTDEIFRRIERSVRERAQAGGSV